MMQLFIPERVYYEPRVQQYEQGRLLLERYAAAKLPLIQIESHNKIEQLRTLPDRGKYCYRDDIINEAKEFFIEQIKRRFPLAVISYIV